MSQNPGGVAWSPDRDLPFMQKPADLLDTAFTLYGFLPSDDDQRWAFLERYQQVKQVTGFGPMNFANAWGATYLSEIGSCRSAFINNPDPENRLQLDRALDNLSMVSEVATRYTKSEGDSDADLTFSLTDRLASHAHEPARDETPCPEALYQVRLYAGRYLARVGFNLHYENDSPVLSIVNIQGVPGGREKNSAFEDQFGLSPFNFLVRRVVSLANMGESPFVVRGISNPARGNSRLYWGVLSQEDIEMCHAHRRPAPQSA